MYGTVQNVAAMSSVWSRGGDFFDDDVYVVATVPSRTQVEAWLIQFSNVVDLALRVEGFNTPLTDATIIGAVSPIVEGVVADMVHWSHKAGRFYSKKMLESGVSPIRVIMKELNDWVADNLIGIRNSGVGSLPGANQAGGKHVATFDVIG